ncbi:hypothetical protein CYL21_5051 [Plasmodium falciparum NF54]|uniref:Uncharacterized protein n=2 Tax=Plasmodium falciparum TaxID=5833 RepID=Q8IC14_PLAF7|nr:conserved Plasmodium protein, unknown function [Plasmodium falciparum 3D7]EWC89494.1 hypothetical protein PFNF54_01709 [Plasmodium falciparum NF54]KAF4326756.1 hypothetical protein CYL21_5051 [Plasmodium falciparum NF54]PKC42142.1 hypothetical protein CK202_5356 [Plasmodium falciparum NF54]CAD50827.1 conserved Plasmodium protein, unknown function [Plasmodium falciparum 3D7]|eukprot:XP_001348989.1 conserved Plasmodium protein, unknown function [Plasmodium falciparum 3D7]
MNESLEIIGEGNKMIVLRTHDKYDIDDDYNNEKKNENYVNNLRLLNNEFNFLNNGNVKIDNMVISYSYFYILKHIHLYSYIFIKRSVLKIVKKNEMKVLNITLQNNWIKKIRYNKFRIFDKSYLADNNFVIFNNEFVELIRNTIDFYYFNKNKKKKKLYTHKIKTYIQHADKLITNIIEYTDKVINYLNDNSDKIIEQITFNLQTFLRYITKKKNIRGIKKYILKYIKSINYNDIQKYVIIYFYDYLKILKQNKHNKYNKMYRNHEKYMFNDIYSNDNNNNNNNNNKINNDDDDIIYDNNSQQQQQTNVGYVEENLFSVPYFLLQKNYDTRNKQLQKKSFDSNVNINNTTNIQYSDNLSNPASLYNDKNSIANQSYIDNTSAQNVHNDMINNNMSYNNIKDNFKYISVEIKLKCGLTDYQNMYDRYNIQQLIKIKNKNTEHLSLYVPSNFFNLDFWDIFCNLNYIFLFNSNNINMYINNKKYMNTSLCSFKYFNNFFFNYSLYFPTNDSINFYFNYLNQYKKGISRNKIKKNHDNNCYDENFHDYFINEYKTRMNTYINDNFECASQFNNSYNNMYENLNYLTFMNSSGEMEEKDRKKKKKNKNKNNDINNNMIDTKNNNNINVCNGSNSSNNNSSSSNSSSNNSNSSSSSNTYNFYYNNNCSDNAFLRASQMNTLVNKNNIVLHNNLQKNSVWKYKRNHYNIINYCQRTCIIPENINYAYKNYIFSNYFYLKYIICGTNYDIKEMLLCIKNGEYRYCFNKLIYILDIYKNMYYVHMKTFCKSAIQKLRKQYDELMNEYYIPEKLRFNSRKDNIYWNIELCNIKYYYEKGKKCNNNNPVDINGSFSRHQDGVRKKTSICKNNKEFNLFFTEMHFKYNNKFQRIISEYLNDYINVNGLKGQFMKFKKYYNILYYDFYKKLKNKFEKKYYALLKGELKIRKDFFKKLQENFKEKVLHKLNKELFYLYDEKLKNNYYFNYIITNKLHMSVRTYFCNCQYYISNVLEKVIIRYREKGYEEQVNYHLFCFLDIMNYIYMKNKNKWTNRLKLLNNSFNNNKEQSKNMIELIQNIMYHNLNLTKKNPFEINQNYNENLVILSCIIRKEKYLFYKLLYFQCFSSGQVQMISVMLYFIKMFEQLFNFRKEPNDDIENDYDTKKSRYEELNEGYDKIFANFKYYNKSLENIFNITENIYIKNHKNLLHFINTQKIKRLSEYVFNSTKKSSPYVKIKNEKNKKKNIKYDAFTYLQNCHFILGNELLLDAVQICNKATNNKYNYLKTEMKVNTRNVYYRIYETNHPSLKKKRFTYPHQSYIKSKYNTRQKFIEDILSKETLITTDHFHYLSSSHFLNHLNSKNISLLKEKPKQVNIKKAMLVYKNMIYFVCRFLISKTFCDNSTIFNIYINHDNTKEDMNTLQYLKNNRFKVLTINKNINSSKNDLNVLLQHEQNHNLFFNSTNIQNKNIEQDEFCYYNDNNSSNSSSNYINSYNQHDSVNHNNYNNNNDDDDATIKKMNKKIYISRAKGGSSKQHYPLIRKIDLKRKKLHYTNQMNRHFKKLITSTYITQQDKKIFYRISLIDLSIKSLKKMDYWKNQMDNIISIYNKFCTN